MDLSPTIQPAMKRPNRRVFCGLSLLCVVATGLCAQAQKRPHTDSRSPFVHRIQVRDQMDMVIQPPKEGAAHDDKAKPIPLLTVAQTCGKCHDYPAISVGYHFNAGDPKADKGRPGEPWILNDDGVLEDPKSGQANTRTQLPLSYRRWPGTFHPYDVGFNDWKFAFAFGRHLPGGGIFEKSQDQRFKVTGTLQNDCMICHTQDVSYDHQARFEQIVKKQNFKYVTQVASGLGIAEKSREKLKDTWIPPDPADPNTEGPAEPKFEYDHSRFNPGGTITFDLTKKVPNDRCYYCHSSLDAGKTSQGAPLQQRWRHDRDIHLAKGMLCVDCHRHGLDHMVVRGYEGEAADRKDPNLASLTCAGCHNGTYSDLGGRLAAPRPVHKGLPTLHFDRLTCTACHSGPWPGEQTTTVLTSMAHRLGLESFNRTDEMGPAIQQTAFLKDDRSGKIAPFKVLYPTFWGRMSGDKITPITPDVLNRSKALQKLFGLKPAEGSPTKPLSEEEILKALEAISNMTPPEPPATTAPTTQPAATQPWYVGEPVFVTGGRAFKKDASGKLAPFKNPAADPYKWALAHDVRGASQAMGARGCTDCHAPNAPIFDGKLAAPAVLASASFATPMHELRGDSMGALTAFALTYPMRPILVATGYTCAVILLLLVIAYASRALISITRRR